jgi:hypothetical protein
VYDNQHSTTSLCTKEFFYTINKYTSTIAQNPSKQASTKNIRSIGNPPKWQVKKVSSQHFIYGVKNNQQVCELVKAFSLQLTDGSIKPECLLLAGLSKLVKCTTTAYSAHS